MSDLGDEMIAGMERFLGHLESGGTIDENQKPRTARELLGRLGQTGVVGMWKDRTDIGDSAEFATELRKRASGGRQDDGLSPADFARLVAWFRDPARQPAHLAFTAGAARDAATAWEMAQTATQ